MKINGKEVIIDDKDAALLDMTVGEYLEQKYQEAEAARRKAAKSKNGTISALLYLAGGGEPLASRPDLAVEYLNK